MKTYALLFCLLILVISDLNGQNLPFRYDTENISTSDTSIFNKIEAEKMLVPIDTEIISTLDTSFLNKNNDRNIKGLPDTAIFNNMDLLTQYYEKILDTVKGKEKSIKLKYQSQRAQQIQRLINNYDPKKTEEIESGLKDIEKKENAELSYMDKVRGIVEQSRYITINSKSLSFIPVRNAIHAQLFYNSQVTDITGQILKNTNIIYNPDGEKVSVMNEIYADFFGPFRIGFGVLVSNKETKTTIDTSGQKSIDNNSVKKDAIQRLLGGGGNAIINVGYPVVNYSYNRRFNIKVVFAPKLSFDVPVLGTETGTYAFNGDAGLEGSMFYTGLLNTLTFYLNYRLGFVFGNSVFYSNLHKNDNKGFCFTQISLGMAINSTFRIALNNYSGDSFVRNNFTSAISFSIIPN